MARQKRLASKSIEKARGRAAGLESISPTLDLGGGLTLAAYKNQITAAEKKQNDYNAKLSEVDELLNQFEHVETSLDDLSERMLAGVAAAYGKDSDAYEKAGGTKKSERAKPVRKPKA